MRFRVTIFLLFALTCVPLLLAVPFPTQDGPAHLYVAHVAQELADGASTPLLHRFFAPSREDSSTRVGTWIVQALTLFCSPPLVPAVLLGLSFAGLFLAVSAAEPGRTARWFPCCFLPLACYGFVQRMGFFSFCLAIPLALTAARLWINDRGTKRRLLLAAAALLATAVLHPMPALWAVMVCAAASVTSCLVSRAGILREGMLLGLCAIPPLLTHLPEPGPGVSRYAWDSVGSRAAGILAGGPFAGAQPITLAASALSAVLLVALSVLAIRDQLRRRNAGNPYPLRLLGAVSAALGIALFAPEFGLGGGFIGVRCELLFFLLLLECAQHWELSPRVDLIASAVFLGLGFLTVAGLLGPLRRDSAVYREVLASAAVLPPSTTVLPIMADELTTAEPPGLASQVRPLLHAGDLLGLGSDRVVLPDYQADLGYFAVVFRPGSNPFGVLFNASMFGWGAPRVRWERLPAFQNGVEHVGIFDESRLLRTIPNAEEYRRVICEQYLEVYRSRDWPWVIYRLKRSTSTGRRPAICP